MLDLTSNIKTNDKCKIKTCQSLMWKNEKKTKQTITSPNNNNIAVVNIAGNKYSQKKFLKQVFGPYVLKHKDD